MWYHGFHKNSKRPIKSIPAAKIIFTTQEGDGGEKDAYSSQQIIGVDKPIQLWVDY